MVSARVRQRTTQQIQDLSSLVVPSAGGDIGNALDQLSAASSTLGHFRPEVVGDSLLRILEAGEGGDLAPDIVDKLAGLGRQWWSMARRRDPQRLLADLRSVGCRTGASRMAVSALARLAEYPSADRETARSILTGLEELSSRYTRLPKFSSRYDKLGTSHGKYRHNAFDDLFGSDGDVAF